MPREMPSDRTKKRVERPHKRSKPPDTAAIERDIRMRDVAEIIKARKKRQKNPTTSDFPYS